MDVAGGVFFATGSCVCVSAISCLSLGDLAHFLSFLNHNPVDLGVVALFAE